MDNEESNDILEVDIWDYITNFDVAPVCKIRIQDSQKIRFEHEEHFAHEDPTDRYLELKQEIENNQIQEYYINLGWQLISRAEVFDFDSNYGEEGNHFHLTFQRGAL